MLEFGITFHRRRVIMWPASALLTGNGIAFVLRVPGTEHGDWWSMNGWWIFAGTAAVALLSKHLIRFRGHHFLNPSNFGLVLCFVLLGSTRADPLALWWGPMSLWMVLALGIIVVGVFTILLRLHLLAIAVAFWVTFALGIGVIAAAGHEMTARWHLGPITGFEFWRVLVFSPEVLIFLFFMITDPKTSPTGARQRRVYAVSIGLLAVLLIAPTTTEFWTKVALLGALTLVCASRPVIALLAPRFGAEVHRSTATRARSPGGRGLRRLRRVARRRGPPGAAERRTRKPGGQGTGALPPATILASKGVASQLDATLARQITRDLVADFKLEAEALRNRDKSRAAAAAGGARLQGLWQQIGLAGNRALIVPERHVESLQLNLEAAVSQAPPLVIATVTGTERLVTVEGTPPTVAFRGNETPFTRTLELQLDRGRYVIVGMRGGTPEAAAPGAAAQLASSGVGGIQLEDVAAQVGIDFQQNAFRSPRTTDTIAMMGGGVCWVDIDNDGWLDLFAVNSYSDLDYGYWLEHGGPPRSAPVPEPERDVHGCQPDIRSRRADPRERLRRRRLQRRRIQRHLRDCSRERCAPLERRQGPLHRGRPCRRNHGLGLAFGSGGRRRERRRAARPLRRGLHRRERSGPELGLRVPERPPGGTRPALPQHRERPERPRSVPGGRREGRHRHPRRARPRRRLHRHQRRRPSRPLRRE